MAGEQRRGEKTPVNSSRRGQSHSHKVECRVAGKDTEVTRVNSVNRPSVVDEGKENHPLPRPEHTTFSKR